MAARDFSAWTPIVWDSEVAQREVQASAVMTFGRERPMTSNQQEINRFTAADVGGGSQLTEDTNNGDVVDMFSYQYNGKFTLDEQQVEDNPANEVESVSYEWLNSFHKFYDNASLGVSATRSATASNFQPYKSVYYVVRHDDTDMGYTADTNWSKTGSGGLTYDTVNTALGQVEAGEFWNPQNAIAIMHPTLKRSIRGIKDTTGAPIFVNSTAGFPGGGQQPMYELFGIPTVFSFGAKVSSNYKMTTTGNPLLIFASRKHLVTGPRIAPQAKFISADINVNALEHTLQTRARVGFAAVIPQAFSVLEIGA
jgi:HK97 family phage major capsid protein